jgi:omega-6 fatty acid desaturase (delta-12 desaturase)
MDRAAYLTIRKKIDLRPKPTALLIFILQNLIFVSTIAVYYYEFQDSWVRLFTIPAIAAFIFRNFSMMHEAVHGAASTSGKLNYFTGLIAGGICFLPFEPWKKSHLEHHLWAGNVDRDPVMAIIVAYPKMPKWFQQLLSTMWQIWFPMLAVAQHVVFWSLSIKIYLNKPTSFGLLVSLLSPVAFWGTAIYFCSFGFMGSVLLPSLFVYLLAVEVVNFPHHLQLPQYHNDTRFPVWQQHKIARSCIYPKWFARGVVLNFNYHTEHHMFPDVAWYHLDKLSVETRAQLQREYNADPYLRWIIENKPRPIGHVLAPTEVDTLEKISA